MVLLILELNVTIPTIFLAAHFVETYHDIDLLGIWAILQGFLFIWGFFLRRFYISELQKKKTEKSRKFDLQNVNSREKKSEDFF